MLGREPAEILELAGVDLHEVVVTAFGGATLTTDVAPLLVNLGLPAGVADKLALVLVTVVISFT